MVNEQVKIKFFQAWIAKRIKEVADFSTNYQGTKKDAEKNKIFSEGYLDILRKYNDKIVKNNLNDSNLGQISALLEKQIEDTICTDFKGTRKAVAVERLFRDGYAQGLSHMKQKLIESMRIKGGISTSGRPDPVGPSAAPAGFDMN